MKRKITLKNPNQEKVIFEHRLWVAFSVVFIFILCIIARLAYLQIVQHDLYQTLAENNRVSIIPIPPSRGLITDRKGRLLAQNIPDFRLEVVPEDVDDMRQTIKTLREFIKISDDDVESFYEALGQKRQNTGIPIRFKLNEEEVANFAVNRYRVPGVDVVAGLIRHYPFAEYTAHNIGYVGRINEDDLTRLDPINYRATQHIGKTGSEHYYEKILHGTIGHQQVEIDVRGRIVRVLERTPAIAGQNLTLTMDIDLQKLAQDTLADKRGAVVLVDTATGGILALASTPSYNPNLFVTGIDHTSYNALQQSPDRPLYNRVLRGQYPPGSTIKPLVAMQALQKRAISSTQRFFDPGYYTLPGSPHQYRDWKREGHGWLSMPRAIAVSCSTYFYYVSHLLGIDAISDIFKSIGFGALTNVDIAGEIGGILPSREWKEARYQQPWFPGETLITGIGQGYTLVTPLQLAQYVTRLANHGAHTQLHIANDNPLSPVLTANEPFPIDPAIISQVVEMVKGPTSSQEGTAYRIFKGAPYTISGKTGTAQVSQIKQGEKYNAHALPETKRDHSLFIGFAPSDTPTVAIAIILENNHGAGQLARTILDAYFHDQTKPAT